MRHARKRNHGQGVAFGVHLTDKRRGGYHSGRRVRPVGRAGIHPHQRRSVDHLADFALDDELKLVVCAGVGEVVPQAAVFIVAHIFPPAPLMDG